MLRHVSCLTWTADATAEQVAAIAAALAALPAQVPEIRSYAVGADLGLAAGNADLAIVADLDDADAWRRYQEHPAHQAVLAMIRPLLASRTAAQFQVS